MKTITRMVVVAVVLAGFSVQASLLSFEPPGGAKGAIVQNYSFKWIDKSEWLGGVGWNNFREWKNNCNDNDIFLKVRKNCETKQVPEPSLFSAMLLGLTFFGGVFLVRSKSKKSILTVAQIQTQFKQ